MCSEVLQILKATAQKYDRSLELNLDSMELDEIMEKLETGKCPAWQTEAYLGHLMTNEENLLVSLSVVQLVSILEVITKSLPLVGLPSLFRLHTVREHHSLVFH